MRYAGIMSAHKNNIGEKHGHHSGGHKNQRGNSLTGVHCPTVHVAQSLTQLHRNYINQKGLQESNLVSLC